MTPSIRFVPGQRWISDTEIELGLGTVLHADHQRVTMLFIGGGERRTYAIHSAPLTRVVFNPGDPIETDDGLKLRVTTCTEHDGIIAYIGDTADGTIVTVDETELSHAIQFTAPQARLFGGQIDPLLWYRLRYETLLHTARLEQSPVRGLLGPRVDLLPHQLYIAHQVAQRHAPRVLLADEVGLGKTVEAGLILHQQLLTGRARRVLIVVPEALQHQWLAELRQRFNLRFSLFDEERCQQCDSGNPFFTEQCVLASIDFFMLYPHRQTQALAAEWDVLVVDEAHHLEWSEHAASAEYQFVEQLSRITAGVLLLTATPEQLGKSAHFARLRLLDPDRYMDFERFLAEESQYEAIAGWIDQLLNGAVLLPEQLTALEQALTHDAATKPLHALCDGTAELATREHLVELLLDRHGTGRVLFRNTRANVHGFPPRLLHRYPLPCPDSFRRPVDLPDFSLEQVLHPEYFYRRHYAAQPAAWLDLDPRVAWVANRVQALRPAKILLICSKAQTAVDLEQRLRDQYQLHTALFHEDLDTVERDCAAARFADPKTGADLLVCSELGSEGRNFQFAHHLILFDLPANPNVLEQRIGRLDRIGQHHAIQIHCPYLAGTAQEYLVDWYEQGLDAFRLCTPEGQPVFAQLETELLDVLRAPSEARMAELIHRTQQLKATTLAHLRQGRDRLLELNSCRPKAAAAITAAAQQADQDAALWPYLELLFDCYQVNADADGHGGWRLTYNDDYRAMQLPGLPEDGLWVTIDREVALAQPHLEFLTWEHPLVRDAMEMILTSGHGNAAINVVRSVDLPANELLLEVVFLLSCTAPRDLQIGRFFPPQPIRMLVDQNLRELSAVAPYERLIDEQHPVDPHHAREFIQTQQHVFARMLAAAQQHAARQVPERVAAGVQCMLSTLTQEVKRLVALKKVNPNVRAEEIEALKSTALDCHHYIQAAHLRMDAIRLIITE